MTQDNHNRTAAFIWSVADLLRGSFKQSQYGRVILPFTLLRRLECVLAPTRDAVLTAAKTHADKPDGVRHKLLLRGDGLREFTRDQDFSSPSAAAAIVSGRPANGRREWQVQGNGQTYAGWQDQQVSQAEPNTGE